MTIPSIIRGNGLSITQLVANRTSATSDLARSPTRRDCPSVSFVPPPQTQWESEYRFTTVEDGLARIGMSWVLMLAMVEPLTCAVLKTFQTMLKVELKPSKTINLAPSRRSIFSARSRSREKPPESSTLRWLEAGAYVAAERMLGLKPEDFESTADLDDVIGERGNMIAGNLKSNLCDAKLECKLSSPKIIRSPSFQIFKPSGNAAERYDFQSPEMEIFVDISVIPAARRCD